MQDPHEGRLDVAAAEEALGINDDNRQFYTITATIRLLKQRFGITDEEIEVAYEQDLIAQLREVREHINGMVRGGLDARDP